MGEGVSGRDSARRGKENVGERGWWTNVNDLSAVALT